eukprot:g8695.t1
MIKQEPGRADSAMPWMPRASDDAAPLLGADAAGKRGKPGGAAANSGRNPGRARPSFVSSVDAWDGPHAACHDSAEAILVAQLRALLCFDEGGDAKQEAPTRATSTAAARRLGYDGGMLLLLFTPPKQRCERLLTTLSWLKELCGYLTISAVVGMNWNFTFDVDVPWYHLLGDRMGFGGSSRRLRLTDHASVLRAAAWCMHLVMLGLNLVVMAMPLSIWGMRGQSWILRLILFVIWCAVYAAMQLRVRRMNMGISPLAYLHYPDFSVLDLGGGLARLVLHLIKGGEVELRRRARAQARSLIGHELAEAEDMAKFVLKKCPEILEEWLRGCDVEEKAQVGVELVQVTTAVADKDTEEKDSSEGPSPGAATSAGGPSSPGGTDPECDGAPKGRAGAEIPERPVAGAVGSDEEDQVDLEHYSMARYLAQKRPEMVAQILEETVVGEVEQGWGCAVLPDPEEGSV